MPHEIEQFTDGSAAFVAARKPGWHRLGTVYAGQDGLSAEQVLVDGKLGGWDVRKLAQHAAIDPVTGQTVFSDEHFLIVRTHPVTAKPDVLGMAGTLWTPMQNEQQVEFLNAMVDGGAGFDTAMSLHGGKVVVITMKLPASVKIAGVDQIDLYVAVINYHDWHGSFTILVTPVRVVCANTLAMALNGFARKLKIRHTEKAQYRAEEARQALGLSYGYLDAFQVEAERMIGETLTTGEFEQTVKRVFKKASDGKASATNEVKRLDVLMRLFTDADTQANIRGTRWAGYQAITEYVDYVLPVRGADDEMAARATRSLMGGQADEIKDRAFSLLRVS